MQSPSYRIIIGDALNELKELPSGSVNSCVTSPPYWQLRDYGVAGQIGLEKTPEVYVASLRAVLREVKRVLRSDGTLWLNLGDTYASSLPSPRRNELGKENMLHGNLSSRKFGSSGVRHKSLVGIPWRVVFAMQEDDWIIRSEIIWHKPNAFPESFKDRPTKAHDYIFLLSKSTRYYYDIDAIREPHKLTSLHNRRAPWTGKSWRGAPNGVTETMKRTQSCHPLGRNRRSVWTIPTKGFSGQHFSTFPEKLVEPCILAGCPPNGVVIDPFAGTGTTLVVAQRLGRRSIGIELSAAYADLAKNRLAAP